MTAKGAAPTLESAAPHADGHRRIWIGLGAATLGIGALGAWLLLPVDRWIETFHGWIGGLGIWGVLAFAVIYVLGALLLAPGAVMTIVGGVAFGAWAVPLVVVCATSAAALAFLIARYLARDRVARLLENYPRFKAVDRAVDEEGWKVVALLRLSPLIPFGLQNYAFGLTSVAFSGYVGATFFGIVPGTALYVYLGAIGGAAGRGESGATLRTTFFGLGLLATIAVTVIVARKAKAKLAQTGLEPPTPQ